MNNSVVIIPNIGIVNTNNRVYNNSLCETLVSDLQGKIIKGYIGSDLAF